MEYSLGNIGVEPGEEIEGEGDPAPIEKVLKLDRPEMHLDAIKSTFVFGKV